MKVKKLENEDIKFFIEYCKRHRTEVDDSYLYDEDLKNFKGDSENPTYVLQNEQGQIIGAVSIMIDDYSKRGKRARFRIFHSEHEDIECYQKMLDCILKYCDVVDKIFVFVPMVNSGLMKMIEEVKFGVERYSFLMVRENIEVPEFSLPEDYEIRAFISGKNEEAWCEIRNVGFAKLKGGEVAITPSMVTEMISKDDNIDGGMLILYHKDRAVGIIRGSKDEYEGEEIMDIGPISILPEYQGKGLGRILLRKILAFAKELSYKKTILCVNAENERAKSLYTQEGFKQVEAVVCYSYDVQ